MTQSASSSPAAPPQLLHAALVASLGILLLAIAFWDFRLAQEDEFLRTNVLVSEIAAGVAAAVCFGGAIHYINSALTIRLHWFFRIPLFAKTRLLMLLQLGAMGLAVYAAGLVILHEPIPGSDHAYLYRGWTPPPETQPAEPR